jgi:hypothetical protein
MATTFNTALEAANAVETTATASRPNLLARFWTALVESRHRAAEREIERYITMHGGVLTDSIERDLSRNFGTHAGDRG